VVPPSSADCDPAPPADADGLYLSTKPAEHGLSRVVPPRRGSGAAPAPGSLEL